MARLFVIMGVSGSGKSTLAEALARETGWPRLEADDFHPARNIAKMRSGHPLSNEDRRQWIASMREAIAVLTDEAVIATCSALNSQVREWLTQGLERQVYWCWLRVDERVARDRLKSRTGHFMPESLISSQFEALEPPEDVWQIDATVPFIEMFNQINTRIAGAVAG